MAAARYVALILPAESTGLSGSTRPDGKAGSGEGLIDSFVAGSEPALLGSKGAGLVRMAQLGLPVPPGLVLTTALWRDLSAVTPTKEAAASEAPAASRTEPRWPQQLWSEVEAALPRIEAACGARLGDSGDSAVSLGATEPGIGWLLGRKATTGTDSSAADGSAGCGCAGTGWGGVARGTKRAEVKPTTTIPTAITAPIKVRRNRRVQRGGTVMVDEPPAVAVSCSGAAPPYRSVTRSSGCSRLSLSVFSATATRPMLRPAPDTGPAAARVAPAAVPLSDRSPVR